MVKKDKMGWALARILIRGMHIQFSWVSQKERHNNEDLDVGRKILIKWISEKWDGVIWTGLVCFRIGTSKVLS
jgi:hypothetical protein